MIKNIANLNKRKRSEKRFKLAGIFSVLFSIMFLFSLFAMIVFSSKNAFFRSKLLLKIESEKYQDISYKSIIKESLRKRFPDVKDLREINLLYQLISRNASVELEKQMSKQLKKDNKTVCDVWISLSSKADIFFKYGGNTNLHEIQIKWLEDLNANKEIKKTFNWQFFIESDSREPEIAGIGSSLVGSFMTMLIFLICALPIGVMCAFYLEEFAPKNKVTDIIEISINNLAAIPSIIYGLLGLVLYLQFLNLPRSSSIVGGMTLFMLVLPVVIIASRNSIRSIPNSIRDAASALGASKIQIALHHLLPLSIPGIMTGTILSISRALGETAPLLMIGMIAFVADIPKEFSDPTTVLPIQIYLWSDLQEFGFVEKTSAAILMLLIFLIFLNSFAIFLRKKFEIKW